MTDANKAVERTTAAEDARVIEDARAALSGVPSARTADEQKHYDSLPPADKTADDARRLAAARTKALAHVPKRTANEQRAYDAMSLADKTADDETRLTAARRAMMETPEGRAARESHEQAMAGQPAEDAKKPSPSDSVKH